MAKKRVKARVASRRFADVLTLAQRGIRFEVLRRGVAVAAIVTAADLEFLERGSEPPRRPGASARLPSRPHQRAARRRERAWQTRSAL